MGLSQNAVAYIEPDEYLALEASSKDKHEYMDGVIYAWQGSTIRGMAGTSVDHNRVAMNMYLSLRLQAAALGCEAFVTEVRLRPHEQSAYFHPDVMARCGPRLPGHAMEVSDACPVVEVLSDTTEDFDRLDKFDRYRQMASLRSYMLISPARRTIEVFRADQGWLAPGAGECRGDEHFELGLHSGSIPASDVFDGL